MVQSNKLTGQGWLGVGTKRFTINIQVNAEVTGNTT